MDGMNLWLFGYLCAVGGYVVGLLSAALFGRTDAGDWGDQDEHEAMHVSFTDETGRHLGGAHVRHDYASPNAHDVTDVPVDAAKPIKGRWFVDDGQGNHDEVTDMCDLMNDLPDWLKKRQAE